MSMRALLQLGLSIVLSLGAAACGDDDHEEEHEFATYAECYQHHAVEEGLSDIGATTECDAFFAISHADNAGCQADHAGDVTDGVPQAAIDAHCEAEFPA
jgi:hypothetical protein